MKKVFTIVLVTLLSLSIAACGTTNQTQPVDTGSQVEMPQFLVVGGGSTGGVFFGVASGFAQLFTNETTIRATAQTTTGGGQNIQLLANKEIEMAIADNQIMKQAFNGEESFDGKAVKEIRAICNIYPTYFQQLVHVDSNISTMADLKGKRLVVGGPGSGTENATRMVYDAHGYDYVNGTDIVPEYLGIASGAEKMQNKQTDGMTSITPYPFASFTELTMTGHGKLISLDAKAIEILTSGDTPYMPGIIPAGAYKNQDSDIETVMMQTALITREDMDEDVIYELTKMIFDNLDYLVQQNNAFKDLTLENAAQGITIPLHPGAERYFKEKGVL